jgi:hypothetical protein
MHSTLQLESLLFVAMAARLTHLLQRGSKGDPLGLIRAGRYGVSLGNIDAGRIAPVAIVAIDALEEVGVHGLALQRDVKPALVFLPPVGLAVANRALVLLKVQL